MPLEQFKLQGFEPILKVGLAKVTDEGVYACGTIAHLDWARQKRETASAAGKASAAARKLKYGTAQPPKPEPVKTADAEHPFDNSRTPVEHPFEFSRTDSNAPAHAHAHAPALSPSQTQEQSHNNHHSYEAARARMNAAIDGESLLESPTRHPPVEIKALPPPEGEELEQWQKIEQSALATVGAREIEWPGLMKLRKIGMTAADVQEGIAWFVEQVSHGRHPGANIRNATGLMIAKFAARNAGLEPTPSNTRLANLAMKGA